jgi:ribonuclease P protein component
LQRLLKEGKRIRTRFLDVRIGASPLDHSERCRIGVIVPKAKHSGVERNRLKRRLRELARVILSGIGSGKDVVLLTRAATYLATFDMLSEDILKVRRALES